MKDSQSFHYLLRCRFIQRTLCSLSDTERLERLNWALRAGRRHRTWLVRSSKPLESANERARKRTAEWFAMNSQIIHSLGPSRSSWRDPTSGQYAIQKRHRCKNSWEKGTLRERFVRSKVPAGVGRDRQFPYSSGIPGDLSHTEPKTPSSEENLGLCSPSIHSSGKEKSGGPSTW